MSNFIRFLLAIAWGLTMVGFLLMTYVDPEAVNMFLGCLIVAVVVTVAAAIP